MKNFITTLFLVLILVINSFGQQVKFENSLESAQKKSFTEKKILLVYISVTPSSRFTRYNDGFNIPEVVDILNTNFITYKVNKEDSANASSLIKKYHLNEFPAFIFFDSKGGLLKQVSGLETLPFKLENTLNQVLSLSNNKSLVDYESEIKNGIYNKKEIENYITKRIQAGIRNNADIIEKYVDLLTIKDLDKYETVLFILNAGPYVDSKAYRVALINKSISDSIYRTAPTTIRSTIFNNIIANSLTSAIKEKNINRALATAIFTRATWGNNYREGFKNYDLKMIQYYQGINDTTNYLKNASIYYDQYYMSISLDSMKRLEQIRIDDMTKRINEERNSPEILQKGLKLDSIKVKATISKIATELNNAAYSFYLTGTRNKNYLTKAMIWSKRSIELNELDGFYDTLAHIYYRLGYYLEAENTQKKAIELATSERGDTKHLTEELIKMQSKTL